MCHLGLRLAKVFRHVLIWAEGCGQEVVEVVEIESYTPAAAQPAYVYTYFASVALRFASLRGTCGCASCRDGNLT